jgi:hypothetical protein
MSLSRQHTWILLSVASSGSTLEQIIAAADMINHALPSDKMLQESLGWLISKGLVHKENGIYFLAEAGEKLKDPKLELGLWNMWDAIAEKLEQMGSSVTTLDIITSEEVAAARSAYLERTVALVESIAKEITGENPS